MAAVKRLKQVKTFTMEYQVEEKMDRAIWHLIEFKKIYLPQQN